MHSQCFTQWALNGNANNNKAAGLIQFLGVKLAKLCKLWNLDVVWCQKVTELKMGLLARGFRSSGVCGREELQLVGKLTFSTCKIYQLKFILTANSPLLLSVVIIQSYFPLWFCPFEMCCLFSEHHLESWWIKLPRLSIPSSENIMHNAYAPPHTHTHTHTPSHTQNTSTQLSLCAIFKWWIRSIPSLHYTVASIYPWPIALR